MTKMETCKGREKSEKRIHGRATGKIEGRKLFAE